MPTYRSINVTLYSQYDVQSIPEFHPLPQEHYTVQGINHKVPQLVDETASICSVYIPVLPGSTFWIGYSVSPPVPDDHYFLFKLYINGVHLVSWSTGKDEDWTGKTMFGLYERPEDEQGQKRVEKRVFCFTAPERRKKWDDVVDPFHEDMHVEIKVHRAHGRKRMERELCEYKRTNHAKNVTGIHLADAGHVSTEHPKRFYKFALIDPVDRPFAIFRYYYRTWEQLQYLGLLADYCPTDLEDNDMSVIEPHDS